MARPLARFALVALLVSALLSCVVLLVAGRETDSFQATEGSKFINPLYGQLRALGEREGIDVHFAREVVAERRSPVGDHPVFSLPEHSVDVLIFGDSVAAWGVTPQVVESVAGLRVATFAHEGLPLNVAQCELYRALIEKYLAPDGRTLFMFSPSNLMKDPATVRLPQLVGAGLAQALARADTREWWSFERYWDWRTRRLAEPLQAVGLALPQVAPYRSSLERWVNPAWYAQKQETETRQATGFMRWDGWTALMHGPVRHFALRSTEDPVKLGRWLPKRKGRERTLRNAAALRGLPGEKLMVVPWSIKRHVYLRHRSLYRKYFADGMGLIDLGKLLPEGAKYPMADVIHMKNETGFEASVALGKWLRRDALARSAR
jgi:hypothetical protein